MSQKPDFKANLEKGARLFNEKRFWDAHEAWEEIWLAAQTEVEQFLQGLIQIAAAYHHLQRGTFRGGVRLFDSGLRRLRAFADGYCGVDRSATEEAARLHRAWAAAAIERNDRDARLRDDEYPQLRVTSASPPSSEW